VALAVSRGDLSIPAAHARKTGAYLEGLNLGGPLIPGANLMRSPCTYLATLALLALASEGVFAQDYVKKDGQLASPFKMVTLQGGFAGFTGVQYTVAPDGTWACESVFREKLTPKSKGKLNEKELAKLGAILEKYDLAKLPAKAGKQPGANPRTITLEFGDKKASLVGQTPPKVDPNNPTATPESRFAGIWEEVTALLTPAPAPKQE
jgi:hypothetical protein